MLNVYAVAIATSSSKATLSTAINDLNKKVGVSKRSASFILPLGASINMDATAIYLGIATVFFAQTLGVTLSWYQYAIVMITSTIGAIGTAGVPSGGIMMLSLVLSSVGLPLEGISLIIGVDRFIDMFRTMVNVNGDCVVTVIVDKLEGTLDEKQYYNKNVSDELVSKNVNVKS
jgi:Na+/H+-dicarboxylate symporter